MEIEYHNLYTHFILVTKGRLPLIAEMHRVRIEKYITGVVSNHDSKLYAIYANPDHVHLLVSRSPKLSEETLITAISQATKKFIDTNALSREIFFWQESASAFSVSKGDVDRVCQYILNQPVHHKKVSFSQEYEKFLKFYQETIKRE
jgi:REP element-mobilizing transposase RayT